MVADATAAESSSPSFTLEVTRDWPNVFENLPDAPWDDSVRSYTITTDEQLTELFGTNVVEWSMFSAFAGNQAAWVRVRKSAPDVVEVVVEIRGFFMLLGAEFESAPTFIEKKVYWLNNTMVVFGSFNRNTASSMAITE